MVGTVLEYVLLVLVIGGFIVTKVLEARQIVRKARMADPLKSDMAELAERLSALEQQAQQIRTYQDLTAGDMNSRPTASM